MREDFDPDRKTLTTAAKILFLIPARGGSKGLRRRTFSRSAASPWSADRVAWRDKPRLAGKPCRIVCSTDSEQIAQAARAWGAETPFPRPAELASDSAKSMDVVLHALDALGEDFDLVVLIQPTSPLVEAEDVAGAIRLHEETGQPVVSVCLNEHPLAWSYFLDSRRRLSPAIHDDSLHQRQGATVTYRLNGAVYVASPSLLRAKGSFVVDGTRGFVMPAERSVDIDTPCDLQIARACWPTGSRQPLELAGRKIGPGQPCFIIAEAGVNHNGDADLARRLIDAAVEAGADAVKFQTFKAESVMIAAAPKAAYQKHEHRRGGIPTGHGQAAGAAPGGVRPTATIRGRPRNPLPFHAVRLRERRLPRPHRRAGDQGPVGRNQQPSLPRPPGAERQAVDRLDRHVHAGGGRGGGRRDSSGGQSAAGPVALREQLSRRRRPT